MIRLAIVGAGRMGWIFANAIGELRASARVGYVVSRTLESAKAMGDYFDCRYCTELEEALPDVDAVVIAAATPAHSELAITCANAKKPFFVEKPIADTLENGRKIVEAVQKNGVQNMVGFHRRFDPPYVAAKAVNLGALEVFRSISRDANMDSSSLEFHLSSGGLIVDLGVHDMDLARWYMGEVLEVQALGGSASSSVA